MRVTLLAIAALLGLLVGGAVVSLMTSRPASPTVDEATVRSIVAEALAQRDSNTPAAAPMNLPSIDAADLNPMIEDFLMSNPRLLERMSQALETEVRIAEAAAAREAIGNMREAIFDDADQVVVGNPDGDVTLVEMFDYNCSYCRGALPDLATLIAEDPNLRVVLKEFPILSQDSVDAARVGVLVSREDVDYWTFHEALFTGRGPVTGAAALAAASELGLSAVDLELRMNDESVSSAIQKSYDIARGLNVTGTPTYIIGDEIIPGAIGIDELRMRIGNMRECGNTVCAPSEAAVVPPSPGQG